MNTGTAINNHRKINPCNITSSIRSQSRNNWADLPKELLEKIGKLLRSRIDVFRYRAVCSSWRSAICLSPPSSSTTCISTFLYPVTICRLEHSNRGSACLVKLVETPGGRFEVLNPLTIPKSDFILGKTINLLECRMFELAKGLHFDSSFINDDLNVRKAVSFRGGGILAIYDYGKLGFRVSGDETWTELGKVRPRYDDLLVYQGKYYVIDRFGMVSLIDKAMNLVKYLPPLNSLASMGQQKNLVESDGNFFVVDTYFRGRNILDKDGDIIGCKQERVDMKVYKLDEKWGTWTLVNSLDDRVFVLGKDVCFSVSANDFPGCEGNCIYFIDSAYLEEDLQGYRFDDEEMECTSDDLYIPYRRSIRVGALSPSLVRYYDEKMGYYVLRVFKLTDHSMRDIEGSPSFKRLFSPPKDCFCSTLSFP